ncbi:Uncharacterised protein [Kingella potus]|uniref:Uncharacterized protein n=1 Tax=Kingella potus TaxID=265175 RepID=A0A377QYD6_9NEIS|nr:Uncharacterised protein [Kingella potus]
MGTKPPRITRTNKPRQCRAVSRTVGAARQVPPQQTPTTRGLPTSQAILGRRGAGGTKKPPFQTASPRTGAGRRPEKTRKKEKGKNMSLEKITAWAVFAATLALLAISGGCEHPAVQSIERQEIKPAVFAPDPRKRKLPAHGRRICRRPSAAETARSPNRAGRQKHHTAALRTRYVAKKPPENRRPHREKPCSHHKPRTADPFTLAKARCTVSSQKCGSCASEKSTAGKTAAHTAQRIGKRIEKLRAVRPNTWRTPDSMDFIGGKLLFRRPFNLFQHLARQALSKGERMDVAHRIGQRFARNVFDGLHAETLMHHIVGRGVVHPRSPTKADTACRSAVRSSDVVRDSAFQTASKNLLDCSSHQTAKRGSSQRAKWMASLDAAMCRFGCRHASR